MDELHIEKAKILIVDDEFHNRKILNAILSGNNYQTFLAANGQEALAYTRSENIDLILLDIRMPEMDGFEVCKHLKSDEKTKDIPMIFISANDDRENIIKGFELGAYDYFTKPVNRAEIQVKINNCLKLTQVERKYRKELTRRKNTDRIIRIIADETELTTGVSFFNTLLMNMCEILDVDFAFVGEWKAGKPDVISTATVFSGGDCIENFEYHLKDTPCDNVHGKQLCVYPDGIQELFPKDEMLAAMNAESYIGTPLFGKDKEALGILVIMDSKPIADPEYFRIIIQALSVRAAAELERKQAQEELKQREEMFSSAFNHAIVGRCLTDASTGKFLWVNDALSNMLGYSRQEFLEMHWLEIIHPDHFDESQAKEAKLLDQKIRSFTLIQKILNRSGDSLWINLNIVLIRDADGQPKYMHGDIIDITESKEAEKSMQMAADIVNNTQAGIYIYQLEDFSDDKTLRMLAANPASEKLTGIPSVEVIGKTLDENFPGLRKKGVPQQYAEVVRSQNPIEIEDIYYGDEKTIAAVYSVKAFPLPNKQVGISFENITKRKQIEEDLLLTKKRLDLAIEASSAGVIDYAIPMGPETYISERWAEILGYTRETLPPPDGFMSWFFDQLHPDEYSALSADFEDFLQGRKERINQEFRIKHKSGHWIFVQDFSHVAERDEKGHAKRIVGVMLDVTKQKRAEQAIIQESRINKALSDLATSLIDPVKTIEDISDITHTFARELTGSKHGIVSVIDPKNGDNVCYTNTDLTRKAESAEKGTEVRFPKGEDGRYSGLIGHALNTRKAFFTNEPVVHPSWVGHLPEGHFEINRFLAVPAKLGKRLVGEICLVNADHEFTDQDLKTVGQLTELFAVAVFRREMEDAIKESGERNRILAESTFEGIAVSDNGVWIDGNERIFDMLGYKKSEILGQSIFNMVSPESLDLVKSKIKEAYDIPYEHMARRKDGSVFPVLVQGRFMPYKGKNLRITAIRDISLEKKAEQTLKLNEERLELALEAGGAGVYDYRFPRSPDTFHSEHWANILGYELAELPPNEEFFDWEMSLVHPEDIDRLEEVISDFLAGKSSRYDHEFRMKHKSGNWIHVEDRAHAVEHDENSRAVRVVGVMLDITDRKKAQLDLQHSEEKFRTMIETSPDAVTTCDLEGKLTYVSARTALMHGYDNPGEMLGMNAIDLFVETDRDRANSNMTRIMEEKYLKDIEYVMLRKYGSRFDAELSGSILRNECGDPVGFIVITKDISFRKQAEEALRESENKFRILFDYAPDAYYLRDLEGRFVDGNKATENLTGFQKEEFIGKTITDLNLISQDQAIKFGKVQDKSTIKQVTGTEEFVVSRKNNEQVSIEVISYPVTIQEQELVLGIARDITERKELQRKILKTIMETEEKERQRFAQDLHDGLGPLLSSAKLYIKSLESMSSKEKKEYASEKSVEIIDEAIRSIREISNNISPHILKNFGLVSAVHSFIKKLNGIDQIKINLNSNFDRRFDENTEVNIFRILVELIHNTIKHAEADHISIEMVEKGSRIMLDYQDNGKGIDLSKVMSARSGLGISNILNRVSSLNGDISFKKRTKKGFGAKIEVGVS